MPLHRLFLQLRKSFDRDPLSAMACNDPRRAEIAADPGVIDLLDSRGKR